MRAAGGFAPGLTGGVRRSPESPGVDADVHSSPGMKRLLEILDALDKPRILDLGSATGPTIAYFAERPCHIEVADLPASLMSLLARDTEGRSVASQAVDQWLPALPRRHFAAVLAWDLLVYLDEPARAAVCARLRELARPGTLLYLSSWTHSRRPARPQRYQIVGGDRLRYVRASPEAAVEAPVLAARDLERTLALAGFRQQHVWLLQSGLQEYLYRS